MAQAIIMPKAGMAMEEGTIVRWLKEIGEEVSVGEPLLEIETDKVSMEVEAEYSGVLLSTLYNAGDVVAVVREIGYIGDRGETAPGTPASAPAPASGTPAPLAPASAPAPASGTPAPTTAHSKIPRATPLAKRIAAEHRIPLANITASGRNGEILMRDVEKAIQRTTRATPLARKIAASRGVDISMIPGGGPRGKVRRVDVEGALQAPLVEGALQAPLVGGALQAPLHTPQMDAVQSASTQKIRGVRRIIAERVSETHREVPPVTLTHPVQIDALWALRAQIDQYRERKSSLNSWLCYAALRALYRVPELNSTYLPASEEITLHADVHLGIAVDSKNGLLIPRVNQANRMSLFEFDDKATETISIAKAGKAELDDLQPGTFTVTNLGMYGITHFTPIIPLPQVAILGLCAARPVLVKKEGAIVEAREMNLLLTVDHRIIDGAMAARYLAALAGIMASPAQLLLPPRPLIS